MIMKKTTINFSPKSEQKTIRHNIFNYRGVWPIFTPVWVGDSIPHTPHRGLRPQTLDERQWIANQVIWFSCSTG